MTTDRREGISGYLAYKAPCRVATTANITLSGTQTIDGIAVVADDRVLVKDQTTTTENGIYVCSSGTWTRATDFDGSYDFKSGSLVFVTSGTVSAAKNFYCTASADPPVIGTSTISFTSLGGGGTGDASTNTSTSVDSEIALFSSTAGKTLKRASTTGLLKAASGVIAAATAGTDYYAPSGTDVAVADGGTGASTAAGAATNLGLGTGDSPQFTAVNIGAATDTTITRAAAGQIAVEGSNLIRASDTASTTAAGIAELATDAETITGTDTGRTITPSNLTGASIYGYIPQNSQSAAYGIVAGDQSKHIFHPSADTTGRTWTIPANASVAFVVGTAITFINQNGAGTITIAITSDTMRLAGAGTTGSRTLAANGVATAVKVTSTEWIISGTGLT